MDSLKEWRDNMKKKKMDKGLILQTVLLFILIACMFLSIFFKIFLAIADFIAGVMFIVIPYNRRKEYKKATLIIFILFGILFMGLGVYNLING